MVLLSLMDLSDGSIPPSDGSLPREPNVSFACVRRREKAETKAEGGSELRQAPPVAAEVETAQDADNGEGGLLRCAVSWIGIGDRGCSDQLQDKWLMEPHSRTAFIRSTITSMHVYQKLWRRAGKDGEALI